MPIKMTSTYGGYTSGQIVTLSDQDESNFVALGVASFANYPTTQNAVISCDPVNGYTKGLIDPTNGTVIPVGGTPCEALGASPAASAAANTTAIQRALDVGGRVTLLTPGVYLINATLAIGGDTDFTLGPGVEIKASGVGVNNLINTKAMSAAKTTVTLTYTANSLAVTVNWTNHGLTTRDSVWITGADQYYYLGVFPVISVTNANAFTIKLRRMPFAAATGTIQAVVAQQNTKLNGGIWNYNWTGGNAGSGFLAHCIRLGGVNNLEVTNISGKDTNKYVMDIGAVTNLRLRGGSGSGLKSDFLKLRAPLFNAVVESLDVVAGDDVCSIQTIEPPAYASSNWTWGDVIGVSLRGVGGRSTTGGVVLYATNADGWIDGVSIEGFTGAVESGTQIRLDNNGSGIGNVGSVTITNPVFAGNTSGVYLAGGLNVDSLVIVNPKHHSTNQAGRLVALGAASITAKIKVLGGDANRCESLFNSSATGGTVRYEVDNVTVSTQVWNAFTITGSNATVYLRMRNLVLLANPGNALINIGGSTNSIYVDADSITTPNGNHVVTITGTHTLVTQNRGFKCDHAVFAPAANSVTNNTNAAFGTGVGLYATGAGASVKLA